MIQKIEKLVSIGKFRDYNATGIVAFNKLTLFYADNGSGKTTITAVLRSLTKNDPEIVRRRISTNPTLPQAAQIIHRTAGSNNYHTFGRSGWTNTLPDIEIFDAHFVSENIYSGFEFNDDQRKQLHQFVIGAAGIGIRRQIEQNKNDKTVLRQKQEVSTQQLIQVVGNGLIPALTDEFIALKPTESVNITQRIAAAAAALMSANANSVIQNLPRPSPLAHISHTILFTGLIADLQTTTSTLLDAALKVVLDNHCKDLATNSVTTPETWLRTGFNYIESKREKAEKEDVLQCPFCKQTIDENLAILKAYTLQFNDEFNALVQRLQGHLATLERFNLDTIIQGLNTSNRSNTERSASWAPHLPSSVTLPNYSIISDEQALKQTLGALISVVRQKLHNPSISVAITEATTLNTLLQDINTNITTYNLAITGYNGSITTFLASIKPVAQAQNEVNRLTRIQQRFQPAITLICANILADRASLKTLEASYTQLMAQQQAAAMTFFTTYRDRINHYLGTVFRTPFQIGSVNHVPPQGKATQSKIHYSLTMDGSPVSFDPAASSSAKDCLSEGDKSTLALAFFLAKLDIDSGTSNKIIIFDDPLSSFDSNRRLYTVQLINDLMPRIKQLVVLSHNEHFLHDISKNVAAGDKTTLRISENYLTRTAFIEPLSLETLVENDYFKHVKELEGFLTNPDITKKDTVLGWMRNVLEAHIRFKFYRQVSHLQPNDRTFGRLITALAAPPGVVFRDNINRAEILSKLKLINGVSCKPHHGEPNPNYHTLGIDPTTINVTQLAHLVQDSLDLIDNLL
jgi:wobble nucleotide-excising tRNase